jgi:glycosyltransferase involved in cell wall biosynthesis
VGRLRVLFDGHWWVHGPRSNQQVEREFIFAWAQQFPDDELTVAVPRAVVGQARAELPDRVSVRATRLSPQGISAIVELPVLARRIRADLVITHNFTPLFGRSAVFVHDVLFETNPEWFTTKERAYFRLMTATMARAKVVFSSSSTEADRIREFGRAKGPVVPIGLGLAPGLATVEPAPVEELSDVDGFVLVVGRLNVRKNLTTVLRAAARSTVIGPEFPIVVVGEPSGRSATLPDEVRAAVDSGAVRFLGFVSDAALAWLYGRTNLFVFASLDEGFGMPALEALHFGAPVLVSDIPVFREILGDHAQYVAPLDVAAVTAAIDRMARSARPDPVDPDSLGYSWRASAERLRAALTAPG